MLGDADAPRGDGKVAQRTHAVTAMRDHCQQDITSLHWRSLSEQWPQFAFETSRTRLVVGHAHAKFHAGCHLLIAGV